MEIYFRIREPIIHGEWEAATSSLITMLNHERVAPLATDLPRWSSDDSEKPGAIQVYQTSKRFLPLLEGELAELRSTDQVLQAGYSAMQYFAGGNQFTGSQTGKPISYKCLGSFGH